MTTRQFILAISLSFLSSSLTLFAQGTDCENLGFELGDFTNWEGYTWQYSVKHPDYTTNPIREIRPRRQTIITNNSGYDPNTGYELKLIPPGYEYSVRLGDVIIPEVDDYQSRCWHQTLRYNMDVSSENALLIIKFALVLQYADDHLAIEEPRFRFTLYNQYGDTIPDCANYDVYASNSYVEGFHNFRTSDGKQIQWRDWTTVGVNLTDYIGQTITIEFLTADCTRTYHFGYGYFVASCQPLNVNLKNCDNDSVASLTAPEGFESYLWSNESNEIIDSSQVLLVDDPAEGSTFHCEMTSVTGCEVSVRSTIYSYSPEIGFSSDMLDCHSNTVQFSNSSYTNQGTMAFLWDFGDGNTSSQVAPEYTFTTSGMHKVGLKLINLPSTCTKELIQDVESFSPPLVGIAGEATYCPNSTTAIYAYGAYEYTWSNGSERDTIVIGSPGGEYWIVGRSSIGDCVSDTIYKTVSEEPDWELLTAGDTVLCEGDISILSVDGGHKYLWNTGDSTNSISVAEAGHYTIVGLDARGCRKIKVFSVRESPTPNAEFTLSDETVDTRHNQISGYIDPQADVNYLWDMGDGSSEKGPEIEHSYTISPDDIDYTISLTATNIDGCMNSSSDVIDIIPFIPNVFSPNGDGINDLFMPGYEVQIMDRYGTLIYSGSDGWDGLHKGNIADNDTYFYLFSYEDKNQEKYIKKGYLTLVK